MDRAVFPPCSLTWGQTMVEVKTFQRSCAHCHTQCLWPCSRPPPTHASTSWTLTGKSGSVSCGVIAPFSWVLVHTMLCLCTPRVCFQSCVNSGNSMVGLMVTSSKRAYATPRSTAPRGPVPAAVHCWPVSLQKTLKHSSASVSGSWCTQGFLKPLSSKMPYLWQVRHLSLNVLSPLLPSCWGLSFAFWCAISPQSHSSTLQPLLQCLPSFWSFFALGCWVTSPSRSSAAQWKFDLL